MMNQITTKFIEKVRENLETMDQCPSPAGKNRALYSAISNLLTIVEIGELHHSVDLTREIADAVFPIDEYTEENE